MMSIHNLGAAVLVACATMACQSTARAGPRADPPAPETKRGKPDKPALPPGPRFERDLMLRVHMLSSFDTARTIERLLIRGRLDEVRYFAQALASEPDVAGMAPWAAQVGRVRERAAALATSSDVDQACGRAAELAEACASCHRDTGAQAEFQPPRDLPPDLPTVVARMARHRWAADRIREGMIGDAADAWRAGLDVLAEPPLASPVLGADRTQRAQRLQQIAAQARQAAADDRGTRTRVYGDILRACAACHVQVVK